VPRRARQHSPGGVYYLIRRRAPSQPFFQDPEDWVKFEAALAAAVIHCRVRVYAYCWQSHAIHMVIRVSDIPVSRLLQSLAGFGFFKSGGVDTPRRIRLEVHRLPSLSAVLDRVHRLHWLPVLAGDVDRPEHYPWSSHGAILGLTIALWFEPGALLNLLSSDAEVAAVVYAEWMGRAPPTEASRTPRRRVRAKRPDRLGLSPGSIAIRHIHLAVCRFLDIDPQAVLSKRRDQPLVFARAWIALRVVGCQIASLETVAAYLGRTPLDLLTMIKRYGLRYPVFFNIHTFPAGGPLLAIRKEDRDREK
jgi:putative transposase